ncbi:putative disease resistance protein RGA1 [Sesamum alatum]|uniref:Disease resistance protein RGA1 n=1 Tax=Sesamum alatum TaxID=300844 RepID=A0AAE1YAA6_9LAMI|nr:putative disease resistance protein RGA1 [Sesamum alatum]
MEDGIVSGVVQTVLQIFSSAALQEIGALWGLKNDLQSLESTLCTKLKHAAYDAENVLDRVATEGLKRRADSGRGDGVVENRFGESFDSRQTSSLVNELHIYGRNEEKEMIMEKMLDAVRDQDDLSVYARLVKAIIESIDGGVCNNSELDPLQRRLQERLRGKRFFLVLDDVWNENHELWDRLKEVLRCGSKGSVLMVTTRIEKVALTVATIGVHQIGYLSEDDSWSLFRQRAFTNGDADENLVAIGKVIVKKCGGVPLAIKALGNLMRFKSHESEWLAIKESEIWQLPDDENGILPALRLSYYNLAPAMRQCFAYCCLFPKDYEMEKKQLIQLWMANGFVPSQGQSDLNLTGHFIFNELVCRSFLQDVKTNFMGEVICKMHDLMHDLATFVMGHETYILKKVIKIPKTVRHLFLDLDRPEINDSKGNKVKFALDGSLRSFIVPYGGLTSKEIISFFVSKQQYLRAMHVPYCDNIENLRNSFCKLEHLRYLVISCRNFKRLPESLTHLVNLQTLKLMESSWLLELRRGLKVMKNLWFLEMDYHASLLCTPPGLGDLIHLHELSIFIVGEDASHQIDQLKDLNLGGSLTIKGLENVSNAADATRANLMTKNNLTSLSLVWTNEINNNSTEHYEEVLQGLQPHHNLGKISIRSYQGLRFPNWKSTLDFENLKEVILGNCRRCEHLPQLRKLPSLTKLKLDSMDVVKCLDVDFHGHRECVFPTLEELRITNIPNLEEWKIGNSFPCLQDLIIERCPKLSTMPFLPTLKSLSIDESSATVLGSLSCLTSLTSLSLYKFKDLDAFPGDFPQDLKNLEIIDSSIRTISNVLDGLSALKTLSLRNCSNLESLAEEFKNLNSLEHLEIIRILHLRETESVVRAPEKGNSLQYLDLCWLPKMEHLPESMQLFKALSKLTIVNCEGLCSLPHWLGSLQSLSELDIIDCEKLNSLPDGFNSLKSLRELEISGCPQLEKRCKKPMGEDWPKISHIPNIYIDGEHYYLSIFCKVIAPCMLPFSAERSTEPRIQMQTAKLLKLALHYQNFVPRLPQSGMVSKTARSRHCSELGQLGEESGRRKWYPKVVLEYSGREVASYGCRTLYPIVHKS